ncbi:hypothetical protein [Marinimicrococcus flavescens]|uniref:Uncharacterized protein n=1 Tax=Marinimicrococcus flavescens TaxID=3031815 RepID=A0AAP3XSR4_9PROT|nr:hypothetical protein [Marinimicrococcus flavescens]
MTIDTLIEGFGAFFDKAGEAVPALRRTPGPPPAPFDALLAHRRTMTEVLAAAWSSPLRRRTLEEKVTGGRLARTVLLLSGTGQPVEFAHLQVELEALPDAPSLSLSRSPTPFGAWLRAAGLEPRIAVETFFTAEPTALLRQFLRHGAAPLWGRVANLHDETGRLLARSLEIPVAPGPAGRPAPACDPEVSGPADGSPSRLPGTG